MGVDMKRPPADFRSNFEAAQPPILIDNGVAVLENDLIERHIMKKIPGGHNLFVPDQEVNKKIENVYSKFKLMLLKRDDLSKKALTNTLIKIDEMLASKGTRFLTGDTMCCFDCELQELSSVTSRSRRVWSTCGPTSGRCTSSMPSFSLIQLIRTSSTSTRISLE